MKTFAQSSKVDTISNRPATVKPPTKASTVKDVKDRSFLGKLSEKVPDMASELIVALILAIVGIAWARLRTKARKRHFVTDFPTVKELRSIYEPHFTPNNCIIRNLNGTQLYNASHNGTPSIKEFVDIVLQLKEHNTYFLVAPTGIGKTTYLVNTFLYLHSRRSIFRKRTVLLGKIHHENTKKKLRELSKDKNAANTILLLDALDEYNGIKGGDISQFWDSVNSEWESLRQILSSFRKVIITVREQFIIQGEEYTYGLRNLIVDNREIPIIKLQHFSKDQANIYVNSRYDNHPDKEKIVFVKNRIENYEPELVTVPLILNYLEFLKPEDLRMSATGSEHTVRFLIYHGVVNNWLKREVDDLSKPLKLSDVKTVTDFCQKIAYRIATTNGNDEYTMTQEDFLETERTGVNRFLGGLSERTLLQKVTLPGGLSNPEQIFLSFAHRSFLEYFLIEFGKHILSKDRSEVIDEYRNLPIGRYQYVQQELLSWQWKKIRKDELDLSPFITEVDEFEQHLSYEGYQHLFQYLSPLFFFRDIEKGLENNLEELMTSVDWKWYEFIPVQLTSLVIDTTIFWSENSPQPLVTKLIPFLKHVITVVHLEGLILEDSHFKCFSGIANLMKLWIIDCMPENEYFEKNTRVTKAGLSNFSNSRQSLAILWFSNCGFHSEHLSVFAGCDQLTVLGLGFDNIDDQCLSHFKYSFDGIVQISLSATSITDEALFYLRDSTKITHLGLNATSVKGHGFTYLRRVAATVEYLHLEDIPLSEESYMKVFEISPLKWLSLSDNTCTPGILNTYKNAQKDIEWLDLKAGGFDDSLLTNWVKYSPIIERLNISDNRISGEGLEELVEQRTTLKELVLSGNPLQQDHTKNLLPFERLEKLYLTDCNINNDENLEQLQRRGVEIVW
ncbi:hypothetical protein SAMN04488128_103790 [Chitinophaga eiseniae]|uniref:Uncharacterized protein n=1 Tax=Chitinophaga eiseniae TaxID=634771 RepID=A0A1T4SYC2_9BACT|nr:hypothetical protein [Chitinophaga eiseniae]SKA33205.1 hypothetical protein SAMN04488128_103790 [Chitinophaga eiseniae]